MASQSSNPSPSSTTYLSPLSSVHSIPNYLGQPLPFQFLSAHPPIDRSPPRRFHRRRDGPKPFAADQVEDRTTRRRPLQHRFRARSHIPRQGQRPTHRHRFLLPGTDSYPLLSSRPLRPPSDGWLESMAAVQGAPRRGVGHDGGGAGQHRGARRLRVPPGGRDSAQHQPPPQRPLRRPRLRRSHTAPARQDHPGTLLNLSYFFRRLPTTKRQSTRGYFLWVRMFPSFRQE